MAKGKQAVRNCQIQQMRHAVPADYGRSIYGAKAGLWTNRETCSNRQSISLTDANRVKKRKLLGASFTDESRSQMHKALPVKSSGSETAECCSIEVSI